MNAVPFFVDRAIIKMAYQQFYDIPLACLLHKWNWNMIFMSLSSIWSFGIFFCQTWQSARYRLWPGHLILSQVTRNCISTVHGMRIAFWAFSCLHKIDGEEFWVNVKTLAHFPGSLQLHNIIVMCLSSSRDQYCAVVSVRKSARWITVWDSTKSLIACLPPL